MRRPIRIFALTVLAGCTADSRPVATEAAALNMEQAPVTSTEPTPQTPQDTRPLLDREAPQSFETATFALG